MVDASGNRALIVSVQQSGKNDTAATKVWIRLDDATRLLVPLDLLVRQDDGAYRLPFSFHRSDQHYPTQMSFPVMEEELHVGKREIDTGRGVRIHKTVSERDQLIEQTLTRDELAVERVAVGRVVAQEAPPQTRYEGDTPVVPVLEEVLVVQKQLLLKEEVRITRRRKPRPRERVMLRSEQLTVERFDENRKQ